MDATEFSLIRGYIEEEFGLSLKNLSRERLGKKLAPRLAALRLKSFKEYYDHLLRNSFSNTELVEIMNIIINLESYFLREMAQFDVFIELFNKKVTEKKGKSREPIKILSAGCSAGQEPYSILMFLNNSGISLNHSTMELQALDINPLALEKARRGVFNAYSLRGAHKEYIQKYFRQVNKDHFKIDDSLVKAVNFIQGNILKPSVFRKLKNLDFIFCRNLLIYMGDRALDRIALNLWEALSDSGYLFLGQSESFVKQKVLFRPLHFPQVTVYQKNIPRIFQA